jgi:hypothetical protein
VYQLVIHVQPHLMCLGCFALEELADEGANFILVIIPGRGSLRGCVHEELAGAAQMADSTHCLLARRSLVPAQQQF